MYPGSYRGHYSPKVWPGPKSRYEGSTHKARQNGSGFQNGESAVVVLYSQLSRGTNPS